MPATLPSDRSSARAAPAPPALAVGGAEGSQAPATASSRVARPTWAAAALVLSLPASVAWALPAALPWFLLAYVFVVEGAAFGVAARALGTRPAPAQMAWAASWLALWAADTTYNVRVAFQQYPNGWHHLGENCHTLWLGCLVGLMWRRLGVASVRGVSRWRVAAFVTLGLALLAIVFVYVVNPIEARHYRLISRINYGSYVLVLSLILPTAIALSMTTLSQAEHFFCQALLATLASGLALSYQASLGDYAFAGWADVGWVTGAGAAASVSIWAGRRGHDLMAPERPLSPLRSYRSLLGVLAFFANASFIVVLRAVGALDVRDAFVLVTVYFAMFVSWFFANLFALSVSRGLLSFRVSMPDLSRLSVDTPGSVPMLAPLATPMNMAEIDRLHATYNALAVSTNHLIGVLVRKNRRAALATLAAQVAHDLGSPAAALNVALDDAGLLPERTRHVIRTAVHRIQDISMQLVVGFKGAGEAAARPRAPTLVSSLVAAAVAEKRTQFRDHDGVHISSVVSPAAYGIFVSVESHELIRILSNLINNSVAALGGQGTICLEVINRPKNVQILTLDNGCGLSEEEVARLGDERLLRSVDGPDGLGLPHAHKVVASFGGRLRFTSQVGIGTTAILELPKVEAPAWFLRAIDLEGVDAVVVVDDDLSAHGLWRQRLAHVKGGGRSVWHLSSAAELRARRGELRGRRAFFIVDYELAGESVDGLELIAELGIESHAALATGMLVVDEDVIARASRQGVRVVPKSVVPALPVLDARQRTSP